MPGFEIFGDEEKKEVQEVLGTGVLFRYGFDQARKGIWKAKTFELEVSKLLSVRHCHLCSSGTAALSIALAACGVGAGDEVIVPPFTFIATIESVLQAGAIPIFADIDETLCLNPEAAESAITSRTKAMIVVHMCGSIAKIDRLKQICEKRGIILIEDACQAFGATYRGKYAGTFGSVGCFSFDSVKTITCGEGGAVITDDEELYRKLYQYADHGHDHIGDDRGLEGHPMLGTNYRISELNAAVGLAQLKRLDWILKTQRRFKRTLSEALSDIPQVTFQEMDDPQGDSATFLSFFLPDEEKARQTAKGLASQGVDGCFYWYDNKWHYIRQWDHLIRLSSPARLPIELIDERPDYGDIDLSRSHSIIGRTISMQIKLGWTEEELKRRIKKISEVFNG